MNNFSICIISIIFCLFMPSIVYAEDISESQVLRTQAESFGISDFIKEADKYSSSAFLNLDVNKIFNAAISGNIDNKSFISKILNLFKSNVKDSIKTAVGILVIILLNSILKTFAEELNNSEVSKIIYYVQYILIVTLIMSSFSDIYKSILDTISSLTGFSNLLIPLLITLMTYTGSLTTSTMVQPILLFLIQFIGKFIQDLIMPVVSIIVVISIVSKISEKVQVEKLSKFMKSSVVWVLGIILTAFVGVLSLEGTLTSSVDGITAKTAKAAVSSLIPVVGKILGDGVDTVLGCGVVLKNAVGIVGVIVIIGICAMPIVKLTTLSIMYSLLSAVAQPIADGKVVKLLDEFGGVLKLSLAIICSVSFLLIIGITLVVKISNSGMMYR